MDYLVHYGVLGMHWGVRRYQPYSTVPRGSGESGKEVGEAAKLAKSVEKANRKIAKRNVKSAFKNLNQKVFIDQKLQRGIDKDLKKKDKLINKSASYEKIEKLQNRINARIKMKTFNEMAGQKDRNEIIKATNNVGKEYVDKLLDKTKTFSSISDVGDYVPLSAGATLTYSIISGPGSVVLAIPLGASKYRKATKETYRQAKAMTSGRKDAGFSIIDAKNGKIHRDY